MHIIRVSILAVLASLLLSNSAMACVISSFSPAWAPPGATLTLTGSGFTGATSVVFTGRMSGESFTTSVAVLSDTQATVTVPGINFSLFYGEDYITMLTPNGVTVTMDPTCMVLGTGSSATLLVRSTVFVEAGGAATDANGGAMNTFFVKSGGTVNANSNTSDLDVIYAEPGATTTGANVTIVPSVNESPVSELFQCGSTPPVTTSAATNVGLTTATLNGNVNYTSSPMGIAYFQYSTDLSYGNQTPEQSLMGFGEATPVEATLNNLTPGTLYHCRLVEVDTTGTNYGGDVAFTTVALAGDGPGVVNSPASGVTCNAANLNGIVNPNGNATTAYFQYGLSGTYGLATPGQAIASGTADIAVQAAISNLQPNTAYHYCLVAANTSGTTTGADQVFQTGAVGIFSFSPPQAPVGTTLTLNGVGFTGASSVTFTQSLVGNNVAASFVVLSDTQMTVTVPNLGPWFGGNYITVVTNAGATVTLNPAAAIVENGTTDVPNGGATVYVEPGGVAANNGSGSDTYFIKSGGVLNGSGGGGGNVAYAEPGATISLAGVSVVQVPVICQSPVPALFQFGPLIPAITTGPATNVGFTGAIVTGTVNPEGAPATVYFQYGTDLSYGSQTPGQDLIGSFWSTDMPVAASLSNLAPGTLYHYRLAATNSGGTNYGADETFTTASLSGGLPGVIETGASGICANAAAVNATVNPDGTATNVYVQYGLSGTYGATTAVQVIASGTTDVPTETALGNLLPNTTYHYNVVAANSSGTTTGSDQVFQTGAVGIFGFSPAEAPAGATLTLNGIGFTRATSVLFNKYGNTTAASFAVVSDTEMSVTVPNCGFWGGGYYITLVTNAGVTVTLDPTATIVGNGALDDSGGGATIYVEAGGVESNEGSGSDTYYIKSGGILNGGGGGGGNVAYAEQGATVTLSGVSVVQVPGISQSPVPALFQFAAPAFAETGAVTIVAPNAATVSGTVNAAGTATTACVQYGAISNGANPSMVQAAVQSPALTYQNQSPSVSVGSGTSYVPVAVNLSGLQTNAFYHYCVAVTNAAGTTYGADQVFTTSTAPYQVWKAGRFSTAQLEDSTISGDAACPAGDGVPNLVKYALGINAMANPMAGLPVVSGTTLNGVKSLTFTYTKMDADTDIAYLPEWCSDLSSWSNNGLSEVIISDNGTSQQVQDSIPASVSRRIFFRLMVTKP